MKANKTMLIIGIICLLVCVIGSLSLCIIADLNSIKMNHTFEWCGWVCFICGAAALLCIPISFNC